MRNNNEPTRILVKSSFVLQPGVVAAEGEEHLVPWFRARELQNHNQVAILPPAEPVIAAPVTRTAPEPDARREAPAAAGKRR